jgi:hypothetical protein
VVPKLPELVPVAVFGQLPPPVEDELLVLLLDDEVLELEELVLLLEELLELLDDELLLELVELELLLVDELLLDDELLPL